MARMESELGRLTQLEHGVRMALRQAPPGESRVLEDLEDQGDPAGQADQKAMGKVAQVNPAKDRTDGRTHGLDEARAAEDQDGQVVHPEDPEAVGPGGPNDPWGNGWDWNGATGVMMLGVKAAAGEIPWSKSRISQLS